MLRRWLPTAAIALLLLLAAEAVAGGPLGWIKGPGHAAPRPGPYQVVAPPVSTYAGGEMHGACPGYGPGVPTYRWGYFGARYRPTCVCHKGYYGKRTQWGYRSGR